MPTAENLLHRQRIKRLRPYNFKIYIGQKIMTGVGNTETVAGIRGGGVMLYKFYSL
jgi:hypothetical protein